MASTPRQLKRPVHLSRGAARRSSTAKPASKTELAAAPKVFGAMVLGQKRRLSATQLRRMLLAMRDAH